MRQISLCRAITDAIWCARHRCAFETARANDYPDGDLYVVRVDRWTGTWSAFRREVGDRAAFLTEERS